MKTHFHYWLISLLALLFTVTAFSWQEDFLTRRLKARVSKSGTQGGDCFSCIEARDTITIELTNDFIDGFPCPVRQIQINTILVQDQYGQMCEQEIENTDITIPYFTRFFSFQFNNPPLSPPFTLDMGLTAGLRIPIDCPELVYDGAAGQVLLQYSYLDCEGSEIVATDLFNYDSGCPDNNARNIFYDNHASIPQTGEEILPNYSFGERSVSASGNVTINKNAAATFRTCVNGKIKVMKQNSMQSGGVRVEKGAFFKASKVQTTN
ncbi:MAG: hypothetical protein AAF599_09320 [Bacteroidota bacterium]